MTALQLALLPNLVAWGASWFAGPGFAIGTGSHPMCGSAAWPPLPLMVILNSLLEAITGPGLTAKVPTCGPGQLCMPNTASMGNCSNRPSLIISRAPPPPSSAGWKIR